MFGSVTAANGAAISNAVVAADVGASGRCEFTSINRVQSSATTSTTGAYRVRVFSPQGGEQCVRVVAWRGAVGASDSVRTAGVMVPFRAARALPDSVRIDLAFGAP